MEEIKEYDNNGKLIYHKDLFEYEHWYKYDSNGNCIRIHHKSSSGFEEWLEYDNNGVLIHYKDSNGIIVGE